MGSGSLQGAGTRLKLSWAVGCRLLQAPCSSDVWLPLRKPLLIGWRCKMAGGWPLLGRVPSAWGGFVPFVLRVPVVLLLTVHFHIGAVRPRSAGCGPGDEAKEVRSSLGPHCRQWYTKPTSSHQRQLQASATDQCSPCHLEAVGGGACVCSSMVAIRGMQW